jgi:hypothetical protein
MIFLSFLKLTFVWRLKQIRSNKSIVTLPYFCFTGRETDLTSIESHDQGWTEVRVTWQNMEGMITERTPHCLLPCRKNQSRSGPFYFRWDLSHPIILYYELTESG